AAPESATWTPRVQSASLAPSLAVPLDRAGRVLVEPDLTVAGHPEVFVIGDLAAFLHDPSTGGRPLPGLAPVAIQMGRQAAANALCVTRGEALQPFRYRDRGMMATIGRNAAVAQVGRLRLTGLTAWLAWVLVHVLTLIGFRNRLLVLIEWVWAYVTFNRGVRLITGPPGTAAPARAAVAPTEPGSGGG